MAEHSHAALERLLEALLLVEVQDCGAERPEEDLGLPALDLGAHAGDDVAHGLVDHRQADGVRVGEARVGQHAHAAAVLAAASEAKDVVAAAKRLEVAIGEHRQRLADSDAVAHDVEAVLAPAAPREGPAVKGVAQALEAQLVAVIHARHARQRHLQQHGEPQAAHRQAGLALGQLVRRALRLAHGVGVGRVAQHGKEALAVVAAQQVQTAVERLARVVLVQLFQAGDELGGADAVAHEVEKPGAHGVVHHAVELLALEVLAQHPVGGLVRRVLPDLADKHAVFLLGKNGVLDLGDELVGELVGHIHAPTRRAGAQPLADHAVLAADQLMVVLGVRAVRRHVLVAPPAGVGAVVVESEPVRVLALLAVLVGLPRAWLLEVLVTVEVDGVAAAVVPHAVENNGDAHLGGLVAQAAERRLVAQHRIDAQVVGRVVAVVARRLEDRVEVDHRDAQALEVAELLADAVERAAVEIPARDALVGLGDALVRDGGVPILDERALDAVLVLLKRRVSELVPALAAGKAIGEDLVDDAVLVPIRLRRARLINGELERRRVAVREGALAGGPAGARAVAPDSPVGRLDVEAVPHDAGLGGLIVHREVQVVAVLGAAHLDELLPVGIGPHPQRAEGDVVVPNIDAKRDDAAQLGGAEWSSVLLL